MLRKSGEVFLHSDEQVSDAVAKAVGLAETYDVSEPMRAAIFTVAAGMYAQKQCAIEDVQLAANGLGIARG